MKKGPFGFQFAAVLGGAAVLLGCVNAWMPANATTEAKSPLPVVSETNSPSPVIQEAKAAATPVAETPLPDNLESLSPGMAEVIKLAQANVSEEVLIAYIEKSNFAFDPSADEILYLTDLGVSDKAVTALMKRAKPAEAVAQAPAPAAPVAPAATNEIPAVAPQYQPEEVASTAVPDPAAPLPTAETETIVAPQPTTNVTINYFYDSLAPYGQWVEVDGYGSCWRPTVVVSNPHWQPYCDRGRWVYSDCGWYWQSDYSWGWAAFHYGRWHRSSRFGWVWTPGTTWGPSWVSWRYTDDHCGWAPLPPAAVLRPRSSFGFSYHSSNVGIHFDFGLSSDCYTFVPTRRFCDPHPYRHRVSHSKRTSLYGRSTVNNYYFVNNKNVIVNQGIKPSTVVAATGKDLKQVSVKTTPTPPARGRETFDKKSNTLVAYRPEPGKTPSESLAGKPGLSRSTGKTTLANTPSTFAPSQPVKPGLSRSPEKAPAPRTVNAPKVVTEKPAPSLSKNVAVPSAPKTSTPKLEKPAQPVTAPRNNPPSLSVQKETQMPRETVSKPALTPSTTVNAPVAPKTIAPKPQQQAQPNTTPRNAAPVLPSQTDKPSLRSFGATPQPSPSPNVNVSSAPKLTAPRSTPQPQAQPVFKQPAVQNPTPVYAPKVAAANPNPGRSMGVQPAPTVRNNSPSLATPNRQLAPQPSTPAVSAPSSRPALTPMKAPVSSGAGGGGNRAPGLQKQGDHKK